MQTPPSSLPTRNNTLLFIYTILIAVITIMIMVLFGLYINSWMPPERKVSQSYSNGVPEDMLLFIDFETPILIDANAHETFLADVRATEARWSQDGTQIIFISQIDDYQAIFVIKTDGTNIQQLTSSDFNPSDLAWSPDGSQIAFTSNSTEKLGLYVMNPDGSNITPITAGKRQINFFEWSPDSSKIAYSGIVGIYMTNRDGTQEKQISNLQALSLDWSPDSTQLVICSQPSGWDSPNLFVINADGSNEKQFEGIQAFSARWSPDNSKIVFAGRFGDIFSVNPAGNGIQQLTSSRLGDSNPVWSRDGSKIAFVCEAHESDSNRNSTICVMKADGSDIRIVTDHWQSYSPQWRP
ncbi:MAG: PD40 domain-containing protein [Chloroflexi bacterium]|nr:PD40 domain-containing protein [Chloroflexota bacterium]